MKFAPMTTALLATAIATGCQTSTPRVDAAEARQANKVEIQFDRDGNLTEVEYHVDPDAIPANVRAAMEQLHPGGTFTDAEREVLDGELLYELTSTVDGLEMEAMFHANGDLHSEEVEVLPAAVPEEILAAVSARFPSGVADKYEEIRDSSGTVLEYHVKIDVDGKRHKLMLSTSGAVLGDFLELLAEVEVPAGD